MNIIETVFYSECSFSEFTNILTIVAIWLPTFDDITFYICCWHTYPFFLLPTFYLSAQPSSTIPNFLFVLQNCPFSIPRCNPVSVSEIKKLFRNPYNCIFFNPLQAMGHYRWPLPFSPLLRRQLAQSLSLKSVWYHRWPTPICSSGQQPYCPSFYAS